MTARIGICLLNIWQPGLGLFRLGRYRAGLGFMALTFASLLILAIACLPRRDLPYDTLMAAMATLCAGLLLTMTGSLILTWRASARVLPRHGWGWRWYGVTGAGIVCAVASTQLQGVLLDRYHNFYSPSESMAPTVERGDRFVAKMRYFTPLKRGDVVVFKPGDTDFIKRIAGLPGDTIGLRHGIVFLDERPVPQHYVSETRRNDGEGPQRATRWHEQFPGEARPHEILDLGASFLDDFGPVRLGPDEYFLLGDNRDNSLDSRVAPKAGGPGLVKAGAITGRVLFRYWRSGTGLDRGSI